MMIRGGKINDDVILVGVTEEVLLLLLTATGQIEVGTRVSHSIMLCCLLLLALEVFAIWRLLATFWLLLHEMIASILACCCWAAADAEVERRTAGCS